jgi:hypothetical protein
MGGPHDPARWHDPDLPDGHHAVLPPGCSDSRHGLADDARALGLDRNTEEGALVAMAGSLDPARPFHRVVAWILLLAFAAPLLLGVSRQLV